jgi:hypothetical protein
MVKLVLFTILIWHSVITLLYSFELFFKTLMFVGKLPSLLIFILIKLLNLGLISVSLYITSKLLKQELTSRKILLAFSVLTVSMILNYFVFDFVVIFDSPEVQTEIKTYNVMILSEQWFSYVNAFFLPFVFLIIIFFVLRRDSNV